MARKKKAASAVPAITNPDASGFVAALVADPTDETARLVFADWLDERADPRAAWLRNESVWRQIAPNFARWFALDPSTLAESLLAVFGADENFQTQYDAKTLLQKLGTPAIPAIRAWMKAHPDLAYWVESIILEVPPPDLRPVSKLIAQLTAADVNNAIRAAIELRFHGAAAESAVPALAKAFRKGRDEFDGDRDDPFRHAICATLARLGSVALPAVPELASCAWFSDAAYQAVLALRPDPDLVAQHVNCDDNRSTRIGAYLVHELDPNKPSALVRLLQQESKILTPAAAQILGELGSTGEDISAALPAMIEAFERPPGEHSWDHYLRIVLAQAFTRIGAPASPVVPVLHAILPEYAGFKMGNGYEGNARRAITEALAALDPQPAPAPKAKRKKP